MHSHNPATYILVHGAWHGAWCWQKVIPLLEQSGHQVLAPDLPGLGQDRTPLSDITFESYVNRVLDLVDRVHEPVILVGHSLGGMTISQVAEERPENIRCLAYLTAFLPRTGETATQTQERFATQNDALLTCIEADDLSLHLQLARASSFFYHDCSSHDIAQAAKLLRPQALIPMDTPVTLSTRFETVPRAYLACTRDRVLLPQAQANMYTDTPCQQVLELSSGHSPFFSIPEQLAACLHTLAGVNSASLAVHAVSDHVLSTQADPL